MGVHPGSRAAGLGSVRAQSWLHGHLGRPIPAREEGGEGTSRLGQCRAPRLHPGLSTPHRAAASTPALWSSKPTADAVSEKLPSAWWELGGQRAQCQAGGRRSGRWHPGADSPQGALPTTPRPATGSACLSRPKRLAALESKAWLSLLHFLGQFPQTKLFSLNWKHCKGPPSAWSQLTRALVVSKPRSLALGRDRTKGLVV